MAKKTYRHVGVCPLVIEGRDIDKRELDNKDFEAELSPELEAFLLQSGAIQIADQKEPRREEKRKIVPVPPVEDKE